MGGGTDQHCDRMELLRAFDETKACVKGLIDSGLPKLPQIFVRPSEDLVQDHKTTSEIQVPTIDLQDILENPERRKRVVEEVKGASERWGFFQVVNHGIPLSVLDGMIDGVDKFHDMDIDEKKKYYTRDTTTSVRYNSSYDLFTSRTASWRDTLTLAFNGGCHSLDPHELPPACRYDYSTSYTISFSILYV